MRIAEIFVLQMLHLHGPDNRVIEINPNEVVSLREPRGDKEHHYHPSTKCVIFTADGKFNAVVETCEAVEGMLSNVR